MCICIHPLLLWTPCRENYLENIEFLISIAYTVPNVSGLLLMIRFGKKLSFVGGEVLPPPFHPFPI